MTDLTYSFGNLYHPVKALLIYRKHDHNNQTDFYIESYDMDANGVPFNGHPLSIKESNTFAKALQINEKKTQGFLTPNGLLPANVLYVNNGTDAFAIWRTPAQKVKLLFIESLRIPSGEVCIPPMIWKAGKGFLQVFAVREENINLDTPLYNAPYFNLYKDGRVCMGNVKIHIPKDCGLEQFTALWQEYFFNSYFSHGVGGHQAVQGNIVQLWQMLAATGNPFPDDQLVNTPFTIQSLLP